jgi:hypothetical protein
MLIEMPSHSVSQYVSEYYAGVARKSWLDWTLEDEFALRRLNEKRASGAKLPNARENRFESGGLDSV